MTNISKQILNKKTQDKLFAQLAKLFSGAGQSSVEHFFSELFTEAERIMFIKRLAIVLMLSKQQSTYRIAQLLKVSDSTVREIRRKYNDNAYASIVRHSHTADFDSKKFWRTVEVLLRGGMPPYGRDRWKGFGFHD